MNASPGVPPLGTPPPAPAPPDAGAPPAPPTRSGPLIKGTRSIIPPGGGRTAPPDPALLRAQRLARWLMPLDLVAALVFLPLELARRFAAARMRRAGRTVHGAHVRLDGDELVLPPPPTHAIDGDVPAAPPSPERIHLNRLSGVRWTLVRPGLFRGEAQYWLLLGRTGSASVLLVEPPHGLTRELRRRGVASSWRAGSVMGAIVTVAWWVTLGVVAYPYIPWDELGDLARTVWRKL